MLHTYSPVPFASARQQQQFEAVAAALRAEANAPFTLLLGNFAPDPARPDQRLDALVLRPRSLSVLQLLPEGGLLHIPDLRTGTWQLDDTPLLLPDGAENPFRRFEYHRDLAAAWLRPLLPPDAANLHFITGLVLFGAPVRLGPEVEARMATVPAAATFHLLPDPARFTRRLAQLASPEIDLTPADLAHVAAALGLAPVVLPPEASPTAGAHPGRVLRQKAGQLWRWLGADDLDDVDAAGYDVDLEARSQEKEQLEQLRTSLQADLNQQLRALEAREAEREQRIAQLQRQLASAAAPTARTPELEQELTAEQHAKATLEASIQTYRTELESRNQELTARIQQLEGLIERLSGAPTGPATGSGVPVPPLPPATALPSASAAPPTLPGPPPAAATQLLAARLRRAWEAGFERGRPLAHQLLVRGRAAVQAARQQPRRVRYAAGAALAAALLAVGIGRCYPPATPQPFRQEGRYGLLTPSGDTLVPARYASIGEFREHRVIVQQEGVYGFVQDDGQEVVKPAYDALYPYAGEFARARIGLLYTFLDREGEEFGAYYYAAHDFAEDYAAVLDYRGWHYITGPEEPATTPVFFQEAYSFDHGLARVKTQGRFTFIRPEFLADTTVGTAPFGRYASATDFDAEGRARVRQNGRSFLINRQGEEVTR